MVRLGREADGHPFVTSVGCQAHVGDLDLHFYGGSRYDRISGVMAMTEPDPGGSL